MWVHVGVGQSGAPEWDNPAAFSSLLLFLCEREVRQLMFLNFADTSPKSGKLPGGNLIYQSLLLFGFNTWVFRRAPGTPVFLVTRTSLAQFLLSTQYINFHAWRMLSPVAPDHPKQALSAP